MSLQKHYYLKLFIFNYICFIGLCFCFCFTEPHTSSKRKSKASARNIGITCLTLTPYLKSEVERHFNTRVQASHGVYIVDVHALSPAKR